MIPVIGFVIGILLGIFLKIDVFSDYATYVPVAILAAFDSIFGGARAALEKKFDNEIFITGFFGNILLATGLTYLGDKLNVPIYIAAAVVFGGRLFNNFAIIRRLLIERGRKKFAHREERS